MLVIYRFIDKIIYKIRKNVLLNSLSKHGEGISLRFPIVIESPEKVIVENSVSFASYVHIWGGSGVFIGENTMIASHVAITSSGHDYDKIDMHKHVVNKPVYIGKNVWIGTHSIILPGVKIGDGVIIGANTIVNKDVPENAIFYGSPGRVIKYRNFKK